jgi:hypothetical protein
VEEKLEPVSRFQVQPITYGFGDGSLSFTAECGFHEGEILRSLHFIKSKERCGLISARRSSVAANHVSASQRLKPGVPSESRG